MAFCVYGAPCLKKISSLLSLCCSIIYGERVLCRGLDRRQFSEEALREAHSEVIARQKFPPSSLSSYVVQMLLPTTVPFS